MNKQTIKIINRSRNPLPAYATPGSSGMDVRAAIDEPIVLHTLERVMIPTGLYIELPVGFEAQMRPRSGLAAQHGITCLNSPGTIDADYRGELKVILVNLSNETYAIQPGERIAQMMVQRVEQVELIDVQQLSDTSRGEGGFGHTGKN